MNLNNSNQKDFCLSENILYLVSSYKDDIKREIVYNDVTYYSVNIDSSNSYHIVVIDNKGRLIYIQQKKKHWKKNLIEKLNFSKFVVSHISLYIDTHAQNLVHLILVTSHENDCSVWNIMHYMITTCNWSCQRIAEITSQKNSLIISSEIDSNGNILLLYKSIEESSYHNRLYDFQKKRWFIQEKNYFDSNVIDTMTVKNHDMNIIKTEDDLLELYYELEKLKNKELMLFNNFMDIYTKHHLLYDRIEELLKETEHNK